MSKNLYMHTMNGHPAMYQPGAYICYLNQWNRVNASQVFVGSLKTIKRQQQASKSWDEKNGITRTETYGYIRIEDDRNA